MRSRNDDTAALSGAVLTAAEEIARLVEERPATLLEWTGADGWLKQLGAQGLNVASGTQADVEDALMEWAAQGLLRERGGQGVAPLEWRLRRDDERAQEASDTAADALARVITARPALLTCWSGIEVWLAEARSRGLAGNDKARDSLRRALDNAVIRGAILERSGGGFGAAYMWRLPPGKPTGAAPVAEGGRDGSAWETDPAAAMGAMLGEPW